MSGIRPPDLTAWRRQYCFFEKNISHAGICVYIGVSFGISSPTKCPCPVPYACTSYCLVAKRMSVVIVCIVPSVLVWWPVQVGCCSVFHLQSRSCCLAMNRLVLASCIWFFLYQQKQFRLHWYLCVVVFSLFFCTPTTSSTTIITVTIILLLLNYYWRFFFYY